MYRLYAVYMDYMAHVYGLYGYSIHGVSGYDMFIHLPLKGFLFILPKEAHHIIHEWYEI